MLVSVISFGSLWRRRFSKEPNAPQAISRAEIFKTRLAEFSIALTRAFGKERTNFYFDMCCANLNSRRDFLLCADQNQSVDFGSAYQAGGRLTLG
jgi:hypothetical protein